MKQSKQTKTSFMSATPVSYRLQFATVAVALSAEAVQLWYFVPMFVNSHGFPNWSNFFTAASQSLLFPLAVFVISFLTTKKYTAPIGRWFIATVKSIIVIAASSVLLSLWSSITASMYNSGLGRINGSMPPWWVSSNIPFYGIMGLTLLALIAYAYRNRK